MPTPTEIRVRQASRVLVVAFEDGYRCELDFEYLRVHSPSAEVKGHGPGQETLVVGKEAVQIVGCEPVGNYAVKIVFDDGHNSGLYTWDTLYALGQAFDTNWAAYLQRLADAGHTRTLS
ncbi:MAG: DUF971 domain-containing protein [Pseudomonadota bacterium]